MDDLSVCLGASSNQALLSKTGTALSILIDLCHETHMHPNLKKGKTEVMFCFRGAGSRELRRQYYSQSSGFPVICEKKTHHISVVSRYLHLGGILHHRIVAHAEITRRLGIAHQAFTQHRRVLYHNALIPWKKRQGIFSTLVLSKLVFGFEPWTSETQQCRDQLHAGIVKLYKRLLGYRCIAHLSIDAVIIAAGLPSPTEILRCSRLRYFGSLYRCGRDAHWGLLKEDLTWVAMLEDDFRWLWQQLHNSTSLPDPSLHFPVWQDILMHHGGYWKKLIKKGVAHACLQGENEDIEDRCIVELPTFYISMVGHQSSQSTNTSIRNNHRLLAACNVAQHMPVERGKMLTCSVDMVTVPQPDSFLMVLHVRIVFVSTTPEPRCSHICDMHMYADKV